MVCRSHILSVSTTLRECFIIPRPKGSGDRAMSLASVCPSVRPYVNILCPLINLKTVWTNLMILQSYVEQVMTMCRAQHESSSFITFLVISSLMLFYAISWPLCNLNTLWNIIMILHSYLEQVMIICRVQE